MRCTGRARSRGSASVELVIVVIPFLLVFLGLIQLALVAVGRLTVEYAAYSAARAAVVAAPRAAEGPMSADDPVVSDVATTVQKAAVFVLAGVSPVRRSGYISTATALGDGDPMGRFSDRAAYATANTRIKVTPASPSWDAPVTAEVRFRFECQVPLAKQAICWGGPGGYFLDMAASHTLTNQGRQ